MLFGKSHWSLTGTGVLAAVASSACCIAPAISIIAGVSGFASAFSWLERLRPFLAGFAVMSLGYAWYSKISSKRTASNAPNCDACEVPRNKVFQSSGFLTAVTVMALLMITFPYYSGTLWYGGVTDKALGQGSQNVEQSVVYKVKGMTCQGCEKSLEKALERKDAVQKANASYSKESVKIQCLEKCDKATLQTAVERAGYQLTTQNDQ
jgi:mercuric ion transport protein